MKEILGHYLSVFFENLKSNPQNLKINFQNSKNTFKNQNYEIWEVSDDIYQYMCDMSEELFEKMAGQNAWWRWSPGSVLGIPNMKYIINNQNIIAWDGARRQSYFSDFCLECEEREASCCYGLEEDILKCYEPRKYSSLTQYICDEIGASQPRNVCAIAMDLAKYNNLTLAELFDKYEGHNLLNNYIIGVDLANGPDFNSR